MRKLFISLFMLAFTLDVCAQQTLIIDASRKGAPIGDLYGIFFEEINHAGDGGIYAELVRNRSFEDDVAWGPNSPRHGGRVRPDGRRVTGPRNAITGWHTVDAEMMLDSANLLNNAQTRSLKLIISKADGGIRNEGFWGINVTAGKKYHFSAWVKTDKKYTPKMTVSLRNSDNADVILGSAQTQVKTKGKWTKVEADITAAKSDTQANLYLTFDQPGTILMDVVSLFPPTFKDRPNGCRPDLAQLLADLHPRFMRFPGGCYVEGQTAGNGKQNRFVWSNTVGPIEQRPGHLNVNWRYNVSDGLGYHEMLQLSEDLGAEPLFVVNVGLGHGWMVPLDSLQPYIQEALDAIEYANGDAKKTKWGKERARNGHPAPFGLRLLEVGNENANFHFDDNSDQSHKYFERYKMFYDAIKKKYPDVQIIGNVESWGTDEPSWRSQLPVDLLDEHYYRSPSWFAARYHKYDSYDRKGPKIYVGEYAVTSDFGTNGHLTAGLGEAIYMLGMERNADIVAHASYAPIFVHEEDQAWRPDMIRFNAAKSFGTPSYWVQNLMANNVGTQNIAFDINNNLLPARIGHQMGVSSWGTQVSYSDFRVTDLDSGKPVALSSDWKAQPGQRGSLGDWTLSGGTVTQNDQRSEGSVFLNSTRFGNNYAIDLTFTRKEGAEGAIIVFGYEDADNYLWWNLGGWGNGQHAIEHISSGSKSTIKAVRGSLETGRPYKAHIEVRGTHVTCSLDGTQMFDFTLPEPQHIYTAAAMNGNDEMIIKLVNPTAEAAALNIDIRGFKPTTARLIRLTSGNGKDENTMERPMNVSPTETSLRVGTPFLFAAQPYSLNIIRLK